MSDRLDKIRDLERRVVNHEKMIDQLRDKKGPHVGPGRVIRCPSCERTYRVTGMTREDPLCPYCGQ